MNARIPRDPPWPDRTDVLHIARVVDHCDVLGPGRRAVIWVQGCPLRCPGCVVEDMLPFQGGTATNVADLAHHIVQLPNIEGITFSGGEPFAQAASVSALIDQVRQQRPLSAMSYSGWTLEEIQAQDNTAQHALLSRLDILVDGPYDQSQPTDLPWRGSKNQRVLYLTSRYEDKQDHVQPQGWNMEFSVNTDGAVNWAGIPPPQFRQQFRDELRLIGIELEEGDES